MRACFLLIALPTVTRAHSAMTIPEPRNAVDSDEKPWGGPVPHPLPFEPWCPFPSKAAASTDDRNISGANGQACFWFSNGCAIGCGECDGSTRGPIPSFTCTLDKCTPTGKKIQFGPKAPICPGQGSMNATMCDPMQRTVNTAAECGGPDDYFFYSPWRAPGYAPVRCEPVAYGQRGTGCLAQLGRASARERKPRAPLSPCRPAWCYALRRHR
jgi:hypothetical protein